jgi:hypothetical protein
LISAAAVTKYAPAPAAAAVAVSSEHSGFDPLILGAIGIGLLCGAMWRAGQLRQNRKTWPEVRDDLINSALAGGANAIAALFVVEWAQGGVLMALGAAMLVGATGIRAIQWAQRSADEYLRQKFGSRPPED